MTSFEENYSDAVEVDGVRFETAVSERVLTIPAIKPGVYTPVQIGIRVTNNTQNPLCFSFYFYSFFPELIAPDGQAMQTGYHCERLNIPIESDFVLATPGESVTLSRNAILVWTWNQKKKRDRKLEFYIPFRDGDFFIFYPLNPGTYQFRLKYEIFRENVESFSEYIEPTILQKVWTGKILTPLMDIHLIQSENEI
jgi:hypothetical protein